MLRIPDLVPGSLSVCIDRTKQMGVDWWVNNPVFRREEPQRTTASSLASIEGRMISPEAAMTKQETPATQLLSRRISPTCRRVCVAL
jgi:hypothetical protein